MHSVLARLSIRLLIVYQHTLSPDHGWLRVFFPFGCCRFTPTCSSYTIACLERFGFLRGWWYGIRRVLRCTPWATGGHDAAPARLY